jgi:hypothetical protein
MIGVEVGDEVLGDRVALGLGEPDDRLDVPRRIDDRRLYPVWKRAGELGIPVLIHSTDPVGFFCPSTGETSTIPPSCSIPSDRPIDSQAAVPLVG